MPEGCVLKLGIRFGVSGEDVLKYPGLRLDRRGLGGGVPLLNDLEAILRTTGRVDVVRHVARLGLDDCWVAAGLVRNTVWDVLHGYRSLTPLADIDVVYFDRQDVNVDTEKEIERRLTAWIPEENFSVKNQARMHLRNGHAPYSCTEDGIRRWPERCTAVGVAWHRSLRVVAPYRLHDLFSLSIRPTSPDQANIALVARRVAAKGWLTRWPRLQLALP